MAGLPQSNIDWARYMEGLQGKVNVDVDNLTPTGKNNIAGLGMPSDRYIDLVLGASDSPYVAPADGYYWISGTSSSAVSNMAITRSTDGLTKINWLNNLTNNFYSLLSYRVKRGETIRVGYLNIAVQNFRFYYAEGAI